MGGLVELTSFLPLLKFITVITAMVGGGEKVTNVAWNVTRWSRWWSNNGPVNWSFWCSRRSLADQLWNHLSTWALCNLSTWAPFFSGGRWKGRRGEPRPWGGPAPAPWHNHAHRFLRQDCHLLCPTSNCLPPLADLTRHPKAVRWVSNSTNSSLCRPANQKRRRHSR